MDNQFKHLRVKPVEEYDGWAIYPDVPVTKGVMPLAKGINEGPDGGEALAKHIAECINNYELLAGEIMDLGGQTEGATRCTAAAQPTSEPVKALMEIKALMGQFPLPVTKILGVVITALEKEGVPHA